MKMELDQVLQTENGQQYFMEFLKKEYSQENLEFWQECQKFKLIKNKKQLKKSCEKIYIKYISQNSANSVNIDSVARKMVENNLRKPFLEIFNMAESQIFQLMQTDSFSRFKKSDMYAKFESTLLSEKENATSSSSSSSRKRKLIPANLPKLSVVYENDFVVNKNAKLSSHENSSDLFPVCNAPIYSYENVYEKIDSSSHSSGSLIHPAVDNQYQRSNVNRFVRFLFPDCSEEFIPVNQNVPIRNIIDNLLNNKNMPFSSYKLFSIQTNENIETDMNLFEVQFADVRVEQRVTFHIHFPEGYQIEVETIPHRLAIHTLKTILLHFGITLKDIEMYYNNGKLLNEDKLMNPTFNLDYSNIFIKYLSSLRTYLNFKDLSYLNEDGICIKSIKFEEFNHKTNQQQSKSTDNNNKKMKKLPIQSFSSFTVDNNFPFTAISSTSKVVTNPIESDHHQHTYVNDMKNIDLADLSFSSDHKTDQFLDEIMTNDISKFNFLCTPNKQPRQVPQVTARPILVDKFNENCYENLEYQLSLNNKMSESDHTHKARLVIIDSNEYENVDKFGEQNLKMPSSSSCTCNTQQHKVAEVNTNSRHEKSNRTNHRTSFLHHSQSMQSRVESPFRKYLLEQQQQHSTAQRSNSCKQQSQPNHINKPGTRRLSQSIQFNRFSLSAIRENSGFGTPTMTAQPDIIPMSSSGKKFNNNNRIQTLSKFHKIN